MAGKNVLNLGSCLSQKELGLLAIIGVNKGPLTGNFCEAARGGRVLFLGCEFAIDALCELKAKTEANKSFNRYSGEIHDLIEKLRTAHGGGRGVSGTMSSCGSAPDEVPRPAHLRRQRRTSRRHDSSSRAQPRSCG
jgi:hypothetical protein